MPATVNTCHYPIRHFLSVLLLLPLLVGFTPEATAQTPNVFWVTGTHSVAETTGTLDNNSINALVFRVTQNLSADLVLSYTLGGTATPGEDYTIPNADYTARTGTFTVPSGTERFTNVLFPCTILNDGSGDNGETITITFTDQSHYNLGNPAMVTITLFEDTGDAAFSITGNRWVGQTLTVTRTQSDPDGDGALTYEWGQEDNRGISYQVISGAASNTYTIPEAFVGKYIQAEVTYTDGSGIGERIRTNWIGPILAEAPPPPPRRPAPPPPPPPTPPVVSFDSVSDSVSESSGAHNVVVNLVPAATTNLTLRYTLDGDATADTDYTVTTPGTIAIPSGATTVTLPVEILNDSVDEEDETLILTLESGTGYTLGTQNRTTLMIADDDEAPPAEAAGVWPSRFARASAGHVLDGIAGRIQATPVAGPQVQLAGYSMDTGHTQDLQSLYTVEASRPDTVTGILKPDTRSLTMGEFLSASSMSWSGESANGGIGSVWAQGAWSQFDGKSGTTTLDGEVLTALLGLDQSHASGRRGLVLSHSQGEGNYQSRSQGQIESTQTLLTPWLSKEVNDRITFWGALGYGTGELTIQRNGREDLTTDTHTGLIAFGSRGVLKAPTDGYSLSLISDVLWFRTRADAVSDGTELDATSAHGSRMRLGVEGSWSQTRKSGRIQTRLESALRHDGGDAERGLGVEVGGGVHWQDPQRGLDIEIRGRTLLVHHDEEIKERGVSVAMGYDPSPIHQGFTFTIKQDWGTVSSGIEGLFQADAMDMTDSAASQRFTTQAGYRFKMRDGRYTAYPYLEHSLDTEERETSLGWRLSSVIGKSQRTLDVKAIRQEHDNNPSTEHRIGIEAALRW